MAGKYSSLSQPQATIANGGGPKTKNDLPRWLRNNLTVVLTTALLLWLIAIANLFWAIALKHIGEDGDDFECKAHYMDFRPPDMDESEWDYNDPDAWAARCQLLYHCGQILIAASSLTMARALFQAFPVYKPGFWTFRYTEHGLVGQHTSAARVYTMQALLSFIPALLHLRCLVILATSRVITGTPPFQEWYRPHMLACLVLCIISFAAQAHQVVTSGLAAWYIRY